MEIPLPNIDLQLGVGLETGTEYLRIGQIVKDAAILGHVDMQATSSVLDVGCGSGRIARHFAHYLEPPGRYVGMDIQEHFVDWCNEYLAPANKAFEFYHQDIFNGGYNPTGKLRASEYRFPFEDASFDVVILYSVFTHLLVEDAKNYLREIARLLKPGGRCYSTWFLMTRDASVEYLLPNIQEGQVGYGFPCCVNTIEEAGLRIDGYELGRWNGMGSEIWQDLLWLKRAGETPSRFPVKDLPKADDTSNPLTTSGTLESLDPISDSFTVARDNSGPLEVKFSRQTTVRAHGEPGRLLDLRTGQRAQVRYVEASEEGSLALGLVVRGQPRPELVQGVVEAVDRDTGVLTLFVVDKGSLSFKLDPAQAIVQVNGHSANLEELRVGQIASIHVIPLVQTVLALDPLSEGNVGGSDFE